MTKSSFGEKGEEAEKVEEPARWLLLVAVAAAAAAAEKKSTWTFIRASGTRVVHTEAVKSITVDKWNFCQ